MLKNGLKKNIQDEKRRGAVGWGLSVRQEREDVEINNVNNMVFGSRTQPAVFSNSSHHRSFHLQWRNRCPSQWIKVIYSWG